MHFISWADVVERGARLFCQDAFQSMVNNLHGTPSFVMTNVMKEYFVEATDWSDFAWKYLVPAVLHKGSPLNGLHSWAPRSDLSYVGWQAT